MVCHDRLTDWDAHPRRAPSVLVDDRILTSCAAACARMDGWWTSAAGRTCSSGGKGSRVAIDRVDSEDRSHGWIDDLFRTEQQRRRDGEALQRCVAAPSA